uniref:Uncharacterized protein n=1 Tax=Tanacetum cinerariifolium TaxID=118510 RepID=A0A699IKY3_TANCI|nr:hypothetical protein [Tanacetum cinerariifolium]
MVPHVICCYFMRYYGEESAEAGSPRVIIYEYDGFPIQPVALPSPDYVLGPEHPPSSDYVPDPEHLSSHVEIPYVPESEYPEYLAPFDDNAPLEDQPLPTNADDESFDDDDDDDTDDEDEEPFEDKEDDDEEEEYLALADSSAVPIVDPILPAGDTEALETVRLEPPMLTSMKVDVPPRKRACLTTPAPGFEVGEIFAAGVARQPGPTKSYLRRYMVEQAGYGITDTWDEIVDTLMKIASTTLKGVDQRVTELDTNVRQRTNDFEI